MPLTAIDFVPKGPVKSADLIQFYNLFTGVMVDQPVTFSNALLVGGNQGQTTVPLKLFGALGQTNHLIDLYGDRSQTQPGWGTDARGNFGWGPGGNSPQDTSLSRIATQHGHASDTAGLLISPRLDVAGIIQPDEIAFANGSTIQQYGSNNLAVTNHLTVQNNLYIGDDNTAYLTEARAHEISLQSTLLINGADAEGSSLTYAINHLQVRSDNLPDSNGSGVTAFDAMCYAGNWLQFNVRFVTSAAGQGWPQKACVLAYDVDNTAAAGGEIIMMGGKIGVGAFPNPSLQALQVSGDTYTSGQLWSGGGNLYIGSAHVYDQGSGNVAVGANLYVPQSMTAATNITIQNGSLYIGPLNRRIYYDGGTQSLHCDWDWRIDSAHDVYTHDIHLVANSGDCTIGSDSGQMDYKGPNGSTNHRFFHIDGSWMGTQAANFQPQSDARFKSDLQIMTDAEALDRVRMAVPVVTWQPNWQPHRTVGFTAQDMDSVVPEVVQTDADGLMFLNYDFLTAILWGALRALDARCQAKGI